MLIKSIMSIIMFLGLTSSLYSQEVLLSCKEEYISDYNQHISNSLTLSKTNSDYKVTIKDQLQVQELFFSLTGKNITSAHSLEIIFSECTFSPELTWQFTCSNSLSTKVIDLKGKEILSYKNFNFSNGYFTTIEENANWFFMELGLSLDSKSAVIKAQFHPKEQCQI